MSAHPTLISRAELAQRLGKSPSTITRWVSQGTIPAIKAPGAHVMFDLDAVMAALTAQQSRVDPEEIARRIFD